MSISKRVRDLEARGGPEPCERCGGWLAILQNGRLDTLTRHGVEVGEEERRAYLEREREMESNGGKCPGCGTRHIEIRIPGMTSKP